MVKNVRLFHNAAVNSLFAVSDSCIPTYSFVHKKYETRPPCINLCANLKLLVKKIVC